MNISITNDVAMVTLYGIPNTNENLVMILSEIANLDISIDMICKSAPIKDTFNLSFCLIQNDIGKIMTAIKTFKKLYPSINTEINGYNSKITFKGEKMKYESGIASSIFSVFLKQDIEVKMITTAETEISCLVDEKDIHKFKI